MEQSVLLEKNPADFAPISPQLLWIVLHQTSGYLSTKYGATVKHSLELSLSPFHPL